MTASRPGMKLGIHFGDFTLPGAPESLGQVLSATAKAADDGGCAAFTLMDHWFQMEAISRAEDPMLEDYTSLGFLAGRTERIRLGLLVSGVTYRHPGLLIKILTEAEIEKTILVLGITPVDDFDAFLAAMEPYARMGVELVEIPPQGQDPAGMVARLGEKVVPRLAELGVA